jgi:hypothetical protein
MHLSLSLSLSLSILVMCMQHVHVHVHVHVQDEPLHVPAMSMCMNRMRGLHQLERHASKGLPPPTLNASHLSDVLLYRGRKLGLGRG